MPTLQNGQTYSNNLSTTADKLFGSVFFLKTFCGVKTKKYNHESSRQE